MSLTMSQDISESDMSLTLHQYIYWSVFLLCYHIFVWVYEASTFLNLFIFNVYGRVTNLEPATFTSISIAEKKCVFFSSIVGLTNDEITH